jgi:hypothetical protein
MEDFRSVIYVLGNTVDIQMCLSNILRLSNVCKKTKMVET